MQRAGRAQPVARSQPGGLDGDGFGDRQISDLQGHQGTTDLLGYGGIEAGVDGGQEFGEDQNAAAVVCAKCAGPNASSLLCRGSIQMRRDGNFHDFAVASRMNCPSPAPRAGDGHALIPQRCGRSRPGTYRSTRVSQ